MKIGNHYVGLKSPPLIIGEMSGNHNKSIENAIKIVIEAKKCGLKFLKLQTYTPDTITLNSKKKDFRIYDKKSIWHGKTLHNIYKEAYTPWDWHEKIIKKCNSLGITCFSTPFDITAVDFLEKLKVPAYKIASFEITDFQLIQRVARTKKPIILSTGMASKLEIKEALKIIKKNGNNKVALLKCTSAYPAPYENVNLNTIKDMRKTFKCEVGLSDHTLGIGTSIASIALGATIIEKHFTLDRKKGGIDSSFSIEPSEMKLLVQETLNAWKSIGEIKYGTTNSEKKSLNYRKSIYIINNKKKNDKIFREDLKVVRPGYGLHSKYFEKLIGKKIKKNIKEGTATNWSMFKAKT
tara:strand:+ start:56 stop:1108 length:1053 start_codon:yes stop_codon:yes gene_type:complete